MEQKRPIQKPNLKKRENLEAATMIESHLRPSVFHLNMCTLIGETDLENTAEDTITNTQQKI